MSDRDNVVPIPKKLSWQEIIVQDLQTRPTIDLGSADVYVVPSESDDKDFYYVLVFDDKILCAKCKVFRFRDTCKHVKAMEGALNQ